MVLSCLRLELQQLLFRCLRLQALIFIKDCSRSQWIIFPEACFGNFLIFSLMNLFRVQSNDLKEFEQTLTPKPHSLYCWRCIYLRVRREETLLFHIIMMRIMLNCLFVSWDMIMCILLHCLVQPGKLCDNQEVCTNFQLKWWYYCCRWGQILPTSSGIHQCNRNGLSASNNTVQFISLLDSGITGYMRWGRNGFEILLRIVLWKKSPTQVLLFLMTQTYPRQGLWIIGHRDPFYIKSHARLEITISLCCKYR